MDFHSFPLPNLQSSLASHMSGGNIRTQSCKFHAWRSVLAIIRSCGPSHINRVRSLLYNIKFPHVLWKPSFSAKTSLEKFSSFLYWVMTELHMNKCRFNSMIVHLYSGNLRIPRILLGNRFSIRNSKGNDRFRFQQEMIMWNSSYFPFHINIKLEHHQITQKEKKHKKIFPFFQNTESSIVPSILRSPNICLNGNGTHFISQILHVASEWREAPH